MNIPLVIMIIIIHTLMTLLQVVVSGFFDTALQKSRMLIYAVSTSPSVLLVGLGVVGPAVVTRVVVIAGLMFLFG